jgi:hypothetical protein
MKGHIRERSPRHWAIILDQRVPSTQKRITRYASFRGTKREAEVRLAKLIATAANGEQVDPSKLTVKEFLGR